MTVNNTDIVFFFLTKDASIRKSLTKIINKYREIYPNLM